MIATANITFPPGSIPVAIPVVVNNTPLGTYLPTLFDSILFKDIVRRYRVKYPQKIHELAHYLTTNHSCEYTCNALKGARLSF